MRKIIITLSIAVLAVTVAACGQNDARVASENLSVAADQFEVDRRIVFMNGITDTYPLVIEGRCSIEADSLDSQLEVTCKTDDGFKKHFLGLSDNMSYFVEQLTGATVSTQHYRIIFKPSAIIPDIDLQ